jgi:hypothetical protein
MDIERFPCENPTRGKSAVRIKTVFLMINASWFKIRDLTLQVNNTR